jgi:hypothetical protein
VLDLQWWTKHKFLPHADSQVIPIMHSPFFTATIIVSHFLHGEAILLAPLFPHSSFSIFPFSILQADVTNPIVSNIL